MKNIPNGSKRSYALLLAVLLAVTASLLLWRPIFKGEVFAPAKLLYHFEPWKQSAVVEPIPWNPLLWDGIAQFYVWRDFVWQTERSGYVPLWNPHQFCGAPMLANSQSAPLYPPHLLLAYFSTPIAITLAVLFYLWWAGFGASLLCRRLGGGLWPSLLAGIVFQLSTFFVSWLQLPSIPATASWYPWIVLVTIGLFESPTWKRMAALGACIGLMLLAGHLQFAFYGLLLFGLLSAYLMLVYRKSGQALRCCGLLIIGIILGFLLSLPQVLPALELSRHSHRQVVASEDGYFAYSALAMPLANLVTYFVPDFFGHPMDGDYWGWTNYAENALFVGIIPLMLALYGLLRRGGSREKWFFLTLIGIALLMAMGTAINRFFYFLVPGFSSTGSPARVLVLAAFALAILSGLGLERMLRDSSEKSLKPLITMAGCMAVLLTLFFILWQTAWSFGEEMQASEKLIASTADNGLPLLVSGFLVAILGAVLTLRPMMSLRFGAQLLVVVSFLFLWSQNVRYNPTAPVNAIYPQTEVTDQLKALTKANNARVAVWNTDWSLMRPPKAALPPNSPTIYGLIDIAGYDSLMLKWSKERLDAINQGDSAPQENGNMLFVKNSDPAELGRYGVKYLYSPYFTPPNGWQAVGNGIYENPQAAPYVIAPQGSVVRSVVKSATRVQIDLEIINSQTNAGEVVSIGESWDIGWRAWVDGRSLELHPDQRWMLSANLPQGNHRLELRYEPTSFRVGLYFGLMSFACILGLMVWRNKNVVSELSERKS